MKRKPISVSNRKIQDLIVLGLLHEGPKHGYELKHIIDERLRYLTEITSGTVYYTLKKLEKNGLVSSKREREGERPERNVYSITEEGRETFPQLARECLFSPERPHSPFNVAFYFMRHLDLAMVLEAIEFQLEVLKEFAQVATQLEANYPEQWPFNFRALKDRQVRELDALQAWHEDLRARVHRRLRREQAGESGASTKDGNGNVKGTFQTGS